MVCKERAASAGVGPWLLREDCHLPSGAPEDSDWWERTEGVSETSRNEV